MKLLLDENLSDRIVPQVIDIFPGSSHVKSHGLVHTSDTVIWRFAKEYRYVIVSKDIDFYQRSLVLGHPPKLVFLRIGNCPTARIVQLLRANFLLLTNFDTDSAAGILEMF